jgi:alkanesulfonate monooxygenase SsuD/methylene tetrahydromethanopterin reductase-like flavin-dependent oxidoreductase (luciferase family)
MADTASRPELFLRNPDWASVFDHFIPIQSDPLGPCLEGTTLLAAMAAQTSRLRCGMLVVGNTYRHPAVLANIAATLDHISGGRLEWGLGAGWWELEHQQYHVPFHTAGRRIRMMGEAARIQKLLWTQPRATFEGRYYQLTDAQCEPKPLQDPLPLWIGGMGEQLTLRAVAESADGWNTFFMPLEAYQQKLDALAGHCAAVGRDPGDIRKSLALGVVLAATDAEARERAELMARALNVPPELLRDRLLVGTPEQAAEQLLSYVALGVGDFLLSARAPFDYDTMRLFIERVAPLVRQGAASRTAA